MKLVWENGDKAVEAPKKLRSAWPNSPDIDRGNFMAMYPVCRLGAMEMQRVAQEHLEQKNEEKLQNLLSLLKDLAD